MLKLINFISLCDRKDCNLENVLSVPPALVLFFFFFFLYTTTQFLAVRLNRIYPQTIIAHYCIYCTIFGGMQYCVLGLWSQNPPKFFFKNKKNVILLIF